MFLYEAIFIPKGMEKPDKKILDSPELKMYIENFGSKSSDNCLVAEIENKVVGAVWTRIINDYGHIDDETPSLSISILEKYRNNGLGRSLMENMINLLKQEGYKKMSLSVQKLNYVTKLYMDLGFIIFKENDEEYILYKEL